jgi:cytochrome c-type biogenesis protein
MTDGNLLNRSGRGLPLRAFLLVLVLLVPIFSFTAGAGAWPGDNLDGPLTGDEAPMAIPQGFRGHRPILEFMTGLSCPSCMNGPHPETEDLYANMRDDESVPWTYVVFHQLNGGGVDGLATDESRERMRHYQPGVSGTPGMDIDGGWHTLGGLYGKESITTTATQGALDDANSRYERQFNPLRPRDMLRNNFKFVNMEVQQHLQGSEWVVTVNVNYLGMDRLLLEEDLRGSLYVFMVEDDVTAYSKVEDAMVLNHNVFRGYAIKAQEITMSPGDTQMFAGGWEIPVIEVDPSQEYPDGEPVPVKTMDVTAIAAIYDLDDTTSANAAYGNPNPVPRCIQSATPKSTAYDLSNSAVPVGEVSVAKETHMLNFEVLIDHPDGVASVAIHFTTEAANSTVWTAMELGVSGEEVCDDEGVCYAYTDAVATGTYHMEVDITDLWLVVTYTDGLGAMGKSEVMNFEVGAAAPASGGISLGGNAVILIIMIVILFFLGVVAFRTKDKTQRTVLAAVMVMVLIFGGVFAATAGGSEGDTVPDIEFTDINGNTMSLSDFEGKVVVLDMMATWCPGCRKAMSELKEVHDEYGDRIEMISVDIDLKETSAQLRDFKKEFNAGWRFTMDTPDHDFLEKFNVKEIPKIIVIDPSGGVVYAKAAEIPASELADIIDEAAMGGGTLVSLGAGSTSTGGLILWAMGLGMLTFFAPCSFPLLPGYMTYYLGVRDTKKQRKALTAGIAAAAGIVLLFMTVAMLVGLFGSTISSYILYLQPVVGVALIILALLILLNVNINFGVITYPLRRVLGLSIKTVRRLRNKDSGTDSEASTTEDAKALEGPFVYGLGYGAAASGCMAPVIIALIFLAASQGTFLGAVGIFLVFALSMAALMVVLTVAVGTYGQTLMKRVTVSPEKVKFFSAALLLGVGFWIMIYFASGLA